MNHDTAATKAWSFNGQIVTCAIVGETLLAFAAIVSPELHRPRVLVVAAAMAIASTVLAARARMPTQVKAGLISIVCIALLAFGAAQDPFGLRAVDRRIADATRDSNGAAAPVEMAGPTASSASSQLVLRGKGDTTDGAFADDLARSVAAKSGGNDADYRIDGIIDVTAGAAGDTYRLTWSIAHQAESLWCGRIVAVGQSRAAVLDSFSTTIAAALRGSRGGAMGCG